MGMFTSNCKECNKKIDWFLEAPSHMCSCGVYMSPKEVEESWNDNYFQHRVEHCFALMKKDPTRNLQKDYGPKIFAKAKKLYDEWLT